MGMPEAIRRFCPRSFLGYSLLIAALLLVPAFAMASRISAIDYTMGTAVAAETPSRFTAEERKELRQYLKATRKKKSVQVDYRLGGYLPDEIGYKTLPAKVTKKLPELPEGYAAVRVGNDIVLISELTRRIVDVVAL